MKWGLCSIAFRDDDVREVICRAAEIGYDEVEIIGAHIDGKSEQELDNIRKTANKAGIVISTVSPYLWLTQNVEMLQKSFAIAERFVFIARRLGARMIRTFTDSGPTGIGSDVASPKHWSTAIESLQKITAMAPELLFAVETHYKTLADTPETCIHLIKKVARPNLKLIYQPFIHGDIVNDFVRLHEHVREIHLNPHIKADSNKDTDLVNCGMDYAALLRFLALQDYRYTCAVEFCKGGSWEELRKTLNWCRMQTGLTLS